VESKIEGTINGPTNIVVTVDKIVKPQPVKPETKPSEIPGSSTNSGTAQGRTWTYDSAASSQVQSLINNFRQQQGLKVLNPTSQATKQALAGANQMAENMNSQHGDFEMGNMIEAGAVRGNVAQEIFDCFYNSPSHKADMISNQSNMSVVVLKDSQGNYFTCVQFENDAFNNPNIHWETSNS
ncbi:MAG: CAP domain-containing protein, partial [Clostridium sp.]|uniref:CAP domain-containing protein n=1 Tax=Clostridium sp. TaxID=1506 RepID=UPI003EE49FC3